jgi:hypothetical protein
MLVIRSWRVRKGLSRPTPGRLRATPRTNGGTPRLPRARAALIWRRPWRFAQASTAAPRVQRLVLDVRHRLDLLLHWTSSMNSFNERLLRSVGRIASPRPERRRGITERIAHHAAQRLLWNQRRTEAFQTGRVPSSGSRAAGLKTESGTYLGPAARPARYLARDVAHRRLLRTILSGGTRDREVPGAAPAFEALKRAMFPTHRHDGRSPAHLFASANDPLVSGGLARARPVRSFAETKALANTRRETQATAPKTHASTRQQTHSPARPARFVRPVELAWRSNPGVSPASAEGGTSFSHATAVKNARAGEMNASIEMHRSPARHQTAAYPDQRSVNRLADEVLGRIERKLRIERERRGH